MGVTGVGDMKIENFDDVEVSFIESTIVKNGVVCDVYKFTNDDSKDLGIVTVTAGFATPKQKVLLGSQTLEKFISGAGMVTLKRVEGGLERYIFPNAITDTLVLMVGDTMQWEAVSDSDLVFAEVCYPPYAEGRFEVLDA